MGGPVGERELMKASCMATVQARPDTFRTKPHRKERLRRVIRNTTKEKKGERWDNKNIGLQGDMKRPWTALTNPSIVGAFRRITVSYPPPTVGGPRPLADSIRYVDRPHPKNETQNHPLFLSPSTSPSLERRASSRKSRGCAKAVRCGRAPRARGRGAHCRTTRASATTFAGAPSNMPWPDKFVQPHPERFSQVSLTW